ncbi:hypothetical protein B7C42_01636 [Nocardia cerradoensis]|uniref:Uncharacterized protein n=1 Tax=Nocardia cerradoensis TaxID=85688 RepID=A0A231HCM6_9NOCA|nr:hypothetical protein [Nocardia cerradoensis]OXR46661.1 hypothetical protein B7C42_01636 [Nocardia cerradoensis]
MAENLGEIGRKVRESLETDADPYEITVMINEAARVGDRLEQIDSILSGDGRIWARITNGREGDLEIRIDSVLAEARQQAATYRQLVTTIHRLRNAAALDPDELDGLADLG